MQRNTGKIALIILLDMNSKPKNTTESLSFDHRDCDCAKVKHKYHYNLSWKKWMFWGVFHDDDERVCECVCVCV